MPKTEVEARFDELVSKVIGPHFKPRGYRKAGNNFRCLHADGSGRMLQFQKSQTSSWDGLKFTINLGFYLPEADRFAPSFTEPACFIRQRIGDLRPERRDWWYELTAANTAPLFQTVEHDVLTYALPFLEQARSRPDMLQLLLTQPGLSAHPTAIEVLHANGYRAEALQRLQQALAQATRPVHQRFYQDLARNLGL
jgi:hypothetical protein